MADTRWNDKLRRRMAEYSQTPPEGLWEAVEAGLPSRKAAAFPWMWALAGVAAAVLAVVLLWRPGETADPSALSAEAQTIELAAEAEKAPADTVVPEIEVLPAEAVDASRPLPTTGKSAAGRGLVATVETQDDDTEPAANQPAAEAEESEPDGRKPSEAEPVEPKAAEAEPSAQQTSVKPSETAPSRTPAASDPFAGERVRRRTRVSKVSASLIAGSLPGSATESYTAYGMTGVRSSAASPARVAAVGLMSRNRATDTKVQHSLAFRIGALFNWSFTEHWGVETGIQLSNLQTRTSAVTGNMTSLTGKTISYIGIPLLAVYTPWRGERLAVYASAGPMFEYGFRSFGTQESYIGSDRITSDTFTNREQDAIWSLGLNAGVQWQMNRSGGLFLQPGVSWHLAGEGNTESYYTVHPVSFALTAGFRFSF